ncbi:prepilin-type N-terminal cleavage/methylation domain-containing protein [Mucisphaera sp.]|uniref:prepilin-type N-terminal cleavage/methylation domain-containing protein n=1 Tax=Mucisphaera sp. TaxID=2913024 RepID=UPI003D0D61F8
MFSRRTGFSLIELIVVLVILAVIAAIAIPRMSRGANNADITALQADLAVLRGAIELYRVEHTGYPTLADIADQLTGKSDKDGTLNTSGAFGPYIAVIPPLKTGAKAGETDFAAPAAIPPVAEVADAGWLYDAASGSIWANDTNHFDK